VVPRDQMDLKDQKVLAVRTVLQVLMGRLVLVNRVVHLVQVVLAVRRDLEGLESRVIQKFLSVLAVQIDRVFRKALKVHLVLEVHWDPLVLTHQYFQRHRMDHLVRMVLVVLQVLVVLGGRENQPDLEGPHFREVPEDRESQQVQRSRVVRENPEDR